jgi:hypothetical protein
MQTKENIVESGERDIRRLIHQIDRDVDQLLQQGDASPTLSANARQIKAIVRLLKIQYPEL